MIKLFFPALIGLSALVSNGQTPEQPLFQDDEVLELSIVANFNNITDDVYGDSEDHKGKLIYYDSTGQRTKVKIELETRGNFRRNPENCDFPPLEVDFDGDYGNTVFRNQNKLKLVTHCRDTLETANDNVVKEYLVYKIYNSITPFSFKVRLCKISYRQRWCLNKNEHLGFLIEDNDMVAARLGGEELDEDDDYLPLDSLHLAKMAVFQYLIGNTDWTVVPLQNMEIIKVQGKNSVAVPYDFDLSAFVNTVYAPEALFIEREEFLERKFRDPGVSAKYIQEAVAVFIRKKDHIINLIASEKLLSDNEKQRLLPYVKSFYDKLENNVIIVR